MKQQDALDTLLDLGARIDRDFTDDELRNNYIFDFDDQEGRVPNPTTACWPP